MCPQSSKELTRKLGGRRIARPTGGRRARGEGSGPSRGAGGANEDAEGPLDPTKFKSREFLDSDDDTSSEVMSIIALRVLANPA